MNSEYSELKEQKTHRSSKIRYAWLLFCAGILLFSSAAKAQDANVKSLSLNEAIELAKSQNTDVVMAGYALDAERAKLMQTSAVYLPQLSLEYNAISTNQPLNVFGFRLMQQSVTMMDFDPDRLNNPDAYENFSTAITLKQPLINPDKMMQRSAMRHQVRSSDEQLRAVRSQKQYEVRDLYYRLQLTEKQLEVLQSGYKTASEHYRQAVRYFEEGMINRADMLTARVFKLDMQSKRVETENELDAVREKLAYTLGLSPMVIIHASDELAPQTQFAKAALAPADYIDNAMLRTMQYQEQAANEMVRAARFSFLPSVNLFGSYEFNDSSAFGFGSDAYMIGANLSWNLFSGLQQYGKVREAQANQRKSRAMLDSYTNKMAMQLNKARRMLQHAELQLELSQETIEQSAEDVRIRTNRYNEGMERLPDLLQAETTLLEARLRYVMSVYQYNLSLASIAMIQETEF